MRPLLRSQTTTPRRRSGDEKHQPGYLRGVSAGGMREADSRTSVPLIASSRARLGVARRNWALDLRTASGRWCRQSNQVLCSACPCADPPHRARATFPPPNPIKCRFAFAPAPSPSGRRPTTGWCTLEHFPPGLVPPHRIFPPSKATDDGDSSERRCFYT